MPGNILRWKGGAGGDILLKLISLSHANICTNVKFQDSLSDQGAAVLDFSTLDINKQTDLITKLEYLTDVDSTLLIKEIQTLFAGEKTWWLKSHYYKHDVCHESTIDLIADFPSLPFAVAANINKTKTLLVDFNNLVGSIKDPNLRLHYSIFSVAKDFVTFKPFTQTITVNQLISGWTSIKLTVKQFGVELDENLKIMYDTWLATNQQYLPSSTYKQCVQNQYYDIDHPNLNLVEKYCLLALSGDKFRLLSSNHV